ncbi:hypothetical protein Golomagni_05824 [Golovinomyces magnicellulatus]|nr:hypothetical protein Golomagni_05824 [Golovinomyces magnicellulatus]
MDELPRDIHSVRQILEQYSNIDPTEIDTHLLDIRTQGWKISRHPFIGRWKFLRLTHPSNPCFQHVLFRLRLPKSKDVFLDLGCGVGQAIRQLHQQGVEGSKLMGTDLEPRFIDLGYDMFRDKEKLGARFIEGDMLDPDDHKLNELYGKVTIIHADSFLHLFNRMQQGYVVKRLIKFLKPETKNALIYGRQAGYESGHVDNNSNDLPYIHTRETFQALWDEAGAETGTRWKVDAETRPTTEVMPGGRKDIVMLEFIVHQIPLSNI